MGLFAEWLAKAIPQDFEALAPFGCADEGTDFFVHLESRVLAMENVRVLDNVWPQNYPDLGDRFEGLHAMMFGATRVIEGIAGCLEGRVRIFHGVHCRSLSVAYLPQPLSLDEAISRAPKWLFPEHLLNSD